MRLRFKVFLYTGSVLVGSFILISQLLTWNIEKSFLELEQRVVGRDIQRIADAFQNQIDVLDVKLGDWAQWDDTYLFLTNQNPEYIQSNLQNTSFELLHINLIVLTDLSGNIIFQKYVRGVEEQPFPIGFSQHLAERIADGRISALPGAAYAGIVDVPEGMIVTAVRPVTPSDGVAEPNGFIAFAYFFDESVISDIVRMTHVMMDYALYEAPVLEDGFLRARDYISSDNPSFIGYSSENESVFGYTLIFNDEGNPALIFRTKMDREIYESGKQSIVFFRKILVGISIFFSIVIFLLLHLLILRKITSLSCQVGMVSVDGTLDQRIFLPGKDEFSELAKDINRMLTILSERTRFLGDAKKEISEALERALDSENNLRKQTKELEKFRLAADKSFNHTVITDPDGHILYANESAVALTGFSLEEMTGKTPALWGRQMSREFYVDMWHCIKIEKKSFFGEITNKKKNGSTYIALARIVPILDDRGAVSFFVATETDMTEIKKQQEQEARHIRDLEVVNQKVTTEKVRAEAILRYLRSIGEAVFATDKSGTIVFSNEAAANMVGMKPEEILGEESQGVFRFCISDTDKSCDFLPFYEAIKFKKTLPFLSGSFLMGKDGKKIPISGTLSPIIEVKHIAGAIVVFQDITNQYELERTKERFLSVAAHQLRTPLGSMRWSMELLEGGDFGKLPKKAKEAIGELRKNSNRMMLLINDLLSVSRINQSELKEEFSKESLLNITREVVRNLQAEAVKKSIRIEIIAPEDLPKILLVRKHIFESVENLVSNAIRYGKENGHIRIVISIENSSLLLLIADDGIGIPENAKKNIFSKFFRAENAIQYFTDGSGLGLSVVKFYVEESHGEISFESEENVGTTFKMKFSIKQK
ncbi:MAG: PAS domain S-box protein [Candidatus Moranbacteria bacterium]|nr:PAS domain S-box protein [Candidatus Moranbacteria bacterium]